MLRSKGLGLLPFSCSQANIPMVCEPKGSPARFHSFEYLKGPFKEKALFFHTCAREKCQTTAAVNIFCFVEQISLLRAENYFLVLGPFQDC